MFTKVAPLPGEGFYTQVPTHWIRDPRIRGLDKAILAFLQTHAIGYRVTVEQIIAEMLEGRDAIYASVGRLVKFSYLVRIQARGEGSKFAAVDYTFGPAAFTQQYERNWGAREDVSAGETASGFSANGSAVNGSAATGEPDTKKIRVKRSGKERSTPPPGPATVPAPRSSTEQTGGDTPRVETQTGPPRAEVLALAAKVRTVRPDWTRVMVLRAVEAVLAEGTRPWPQIRRVMLRLAADTGTQLPGRLLALPDSYWSDGEPPSMRRWPVWCGECVEATRLQTVTGPDGRDQAGQCPRCHPSTQLAATG